MKYLLIVWTKFLKYLNTAPAGDHATLGGYAGLCDLDHNEHRHHEG